MASVYANKVQGKSLNAGLSWIALSQIKQNSDNARTHSAGQIRQIANSIMAFGFTNPLLVSEKFELIAGEGRYKAAGLLGISEVPVIVISGLSPAKRRALAIADNKLAQNSKWDREKLAIEIPKLADVLVAEGLDISVTGFSSVEIENIESDFVRTAADPQDRIDPNWWRDDFIVNKAGDLWALGDHRLLCGRGHFAEDVDRLMAGDHADLAFFDSQMGEEKSADIVGVLRLALNAAVKASREGATHFIWIDRRYLSEFMVVTNSIYGRPIDIVVWVQSHAGSGSFYGSQHELIGVFRIGDTPDCEQGRKRRSNVWRYRETRFTQDKREHQSKPVALLAEAINDCTHKGDVVLDIASGVGTTILAAERTRRQARALETDPRLVDVAIRRWQASARKKAVHCERGLTFDEIAAIGHAT